MRSFKKDTFNDKGRVPVKWRNPFLRSVGLSCYRNSARDIANILKIDIDVWMWKSEQDIRRRLLEMAEKLKKRNDKPNDSY